MRKEVGRGTAGTREREDAEGTEPEGWGWRAVRDIVTQSEDTGKEDQ